MAKCSSPAAANNPTEAAKKAADNSIVGRPSFLEPLQRTPGSAAEQWLIVIQMTVTRGGRTFSLSCLAHGTMSWEAAVEAIRS